ncbi:hypothetical protein DOTSEDRAFT_56451 [Dothistroma septosporum NZE10]|uniref:Prenylcysteine lyase domain-containing protein n=1 Tax=Dothistroma septosporum (strain NZE10 / CBS 128990) TaxID=675120 RepID=N1PF53_DOTSN|nr:hypothetical protein DOTSEDRAFT_56451 [Dothistroma septosporum NZE10]
MKLSSYAIAAFGWLSDAQEQIPLRVNDHHRPTNIAIIGAGAGGSSTAYFLSKYAHNASIPLNITVFDRNSYVGGRSTIVSAYNDTSLPVELGASIFVDINHILLEAAKEFNLSTSGFSGDAYHADGSKVPGAQLAIWDGEKIVLTANGGWFDLAKLFWKYGWAPVKTQKLMKKVVGKFMELYDAPIFPFASLTQAAQDTGLIAVASATGEQYMRENGITGPFGREVVQASTRVNYAQNLGYIHGLEAMVCMATDGAMAIDGGNWRIFDGMVKSSGAHLKLNTEVGGVWPQQHGKYALNYSHPDGTGSGSQLFDAVVLASPYQYSELKSLGVVSGHHPDELPYVELHVTLFTSPHLLSPEFFNMPADKPAPQVILTTLPAGEPAREGKKGVGSPGFFSISLLRPVVNPNKSQQEYLYKIFSPSPPDSEWLANLLGVPDLPGGGKEIVSGRDITWIYRKVWNSYPYEFPRVTFEDPKLGKNLYYTSGMDSFISTMETNALMGKNVARLLVDELLSKKAGSPLVEDALSAQ